MKGSGKEEITKTTCPYCGVGCGVLAIKDAGGTISVQGDGEHPANYGRLCSKGSALAETLSLEDRLLSPQAHGNKVSWDVALDQVATQFSNTIAEFGPDSVAFYVSGQLLTEDYYVANKLMKGYIGSANIDTNSRLCMASSVAGHKRAFGSDTVPGTYEDLELADLVILVGSNLSWCHPVLFQRLVASQEKNSNKKIIVIDPRRTPTVEIGAEHLAIKPGGDVALFNGLLSYLYAHDIIDEFYVSNYTTGFKDALHAAQSLSLQDISDLTGLSEKQILEFYECFAKTEKVVTVYSQGVNQSSAGTDKVNSILNCHLFTGRIGKPGMGPFSVTGQPNAMGGREVGGLANQLAAHMDLDNPEHRDLVQRFWNSPKIASCQGLKAVDLFRAVKMGHVKAIWIMATNPVESMPEADEVAAALEACPFVVVSDVVNNTGTAAYADILLPAAAWGEKNGTVTNSERRISRQAAFLPSPGEVRPDWWIMCEVAKRMGFEEAFGFSSPAEVFAEYAAQTAFENNGERDLNLLGLSNLTEEQYESLLPTQWPILKGESENKKDTRFFAKGDFFTKERKARFVATPFRSPISKKSELRPFILNTGRIRDQWHTMTRTGRSPRLFNHMAEPYVEIHPEDANALGLKPASLVQVESDKGQVIVRVLITLRQQIGSLFMPIHWNNEYASLARVDALVAGHVDPISGQPELKYTPVSLKPCDMAWYGFAVSLNKPMAQACRYWAFARADKGWRMELAGSPETLNISDESLKALLNFSDHQDLEIVSYQDNATGDYRTAIFLDNKFCGAYFVSREPVAVSRAWIVGLLNEVFPGAKAKRALLAGRAAGAHEDPGAIICSCFNVGFNQITTAIEKQGCMSLEAIGEKLSAGTNCGSCRAEIQSIIATYGVTEAAE